MDRRNALSSLAKLGAMGAASLTAGAAVAEAPAAKSPGQSNPLLPTDNKPGLRYFSKAEAEELAAIYDCLIPADELGRSASQLGCVEFTDRQLVSPYGRAESVYRLGPFREGTPQQGPQLKQTPAERYRRGLVELGELCNRSYGKRFSQLGEDQQVALLKQMEAGQLSFHGLDAQEFFALLLQNVREGYLADPMYGGNRDMEGWRLVGFPGARYDYRMYVNKKGRPLGLEPVSLLGSAKVDLG